MANDTVLTIFVVIAALAFLTQAVLTYLIYVSLRELPGKVEAIRADFRQRFDPLAESITEILTISREPVGTLTANLAEISRILRERANHIDGLVADLVDKSRLQIIRVDQMVSEIMRKVETTTDTLQRSVLAPIQEISAVIKGIRSALQFLLGRRPSTVSEATQDEQMFI